LIFVNELPALLRAAGHVMRLPRIFECRFRSLSG
jgi:hypothetical protein